MSDVLSEIEHAIGWPLYLHEVGSQTRVTLTYTYYANRSNVFEDVQILVPERFSDSRGFFSETDDKSKQAALGES
jgi:hypothetical protein